MSAPDFDALDVVRMLREACKAAGSQRAWAERHQVPPTVVCDVIRGERDPSPTILRALGLRLKRPRYEHIPVKGSVAA